MYKITYHYFKDNVWSTEYSFESHKLDVIKLELRNLKRHAKWHGTQINYKVTKTIETESGIFDFTKDGKE